MVHTGMLKLGICNTAAGSAEKGRRGQTGTKVIHDHAICRCKKENKGCLVLHNLCANTVKKITNIGIKIRHLKTLQLITEVDSTSV